MDQVRQEITDGRWRHDHFHPYGRRLRLLVVQGGHLHGGDLGLQEAQLGPWANPLYKALSRNMR
jgi:hypothetical protein